jgi:hypothetical protein
MRYHRKNASSLYCCAIYIDRIQILDDGVCVFEALSIQLLDNGFHPRKSSHAHHGAACSENGMTMVPWCLGRRALVSIPHHKHQTEGQQILL